MISGIVLAAGTSSRFGRTKQLIELGGKPLVQHAVDAAADLDEVVVVLGHDAERVRAALALPANARAIVNASFQDGQASSLAAGLAAADAESEAAVVLLADQPGITREQVRLLVEAFRERGARIVRLRFRDGPGPALLARAAWQEAGALSGDTGARALIAAHRGWVEEVPIDADAPPDVDSSEDLDRLFNSRD